MAALKQADQLGGRGMALIRIEQMQVALHRIPAHKALQREIGRRKVRRFVIPLGRTSRAHIGQAAQIGAARRAVVAAHARRIEHRLHLAVEGKSAHRSAPRLDLGRRLQQREALRLRADAAVLLFVAARARLHLAGHGGEPASHRLQRASFGIQRLERDRRVGGNLEKGRAVGLDRHGAQNAAHVPRAVKSHAVPLRPHAAVGKGIGKDAQPFDGAARHAPEARTAVNIHDFGEAGFFRRCHAVGKLRRPRARHKRNRLEYRPLRIFVEQQQIAVQIGVIESPQRVRTGLGRDKECVARHGHRIEELRP